MTGRTRGAVARLEAEPNRRAGSALGAPVEVRRHPGARRMTLKVSPTRRAVIVTMPAGVHLDEADRFLARHIDWVRERLDEIPEAHPFEHGGKVPIRGALHTISFAGPWHPLAGLGAREVVRIEAAPSAFGASPIVHIAGQAQHAPRRLQDWLIAQARKDLSQRVAWHAQILGVRPKRISVRDQTSRWGSCSSTGQLCFSWRLILAPSQVLDYVAAHEVAHLREMNHSHRFWALVRRSMPEMDAAKQWLALNGRSLHAYGRPGSEG